MFKKILGTVAALSLGAVLLPATAYAEENPQPEEKPAINLIEGPKVKITYSKDDIPGTSNKPCGTVVHYSSAPLPGPIKISLNVNPQYKPGRELTKSYDKGQKVDFSFTVDCSRDGLKAEYMAQSYWDKEKVQVVHAFDLEDPEKMKDLRGDVYVDYLTGETEVHFRSGQVAKPKVVKKPQAAGQKSKSQTQVKVAKVPGKTQRSKLANTGTEVQSALLLAALLTVGGLVLVTVGKKVK